MSLKGRIDDLVNALGVNPRPTFPEIKARLIEFGSLAEALEDGQSAFEAQLEKAAFEAEIKSLKTERNELKAALELANTEIVRLQATDDKGHRDKTEDEVLKAIAMLGEMHCGDFAQQTNISADRAEVCLADLEKAGLVYVLKKPIIANGGSIAVPAVYDLSIEGKRYLLNQGFLS